MTQDDLRRAKLAINIEGRKIKFVKLSVSLLLQYKNEHT